ncbi:MAG: M28 family peptidase [Planctomycetota bacterium]
MSGASISSDRQRTPEIESRWVLRWLAAIIGSWLLLWLLSSYRDRGPDVPTDLAEKSGFNAAQAEVWLREVFEPEEPHPSGSAANLRVRERIASLVARWGLEVVRQETELARRPGEPAFPLCNLMFRITGSAASDSAVLVVAHHDSVTTGPGIGDDGSGVAIVLELARTLQKEASPRNDVIFLLTDGEERGLLGARQFCAEHPWAKQARVAINLEARGTSGPSLMFQTGAPNRWLMELFAKHVSRPRTSSLFFEIYRFLPNDTDFTIFNRAGINGFNFAFIGDVVNYHTKHDNLQNLSRRSLQHQGQNAREVLWALAQADLDVPREGNAVYFDLLSQWLIWWPVPWTLPIASGLLLLTVLFTWMGARSQIEERENLTLSRLVLRWLSDLLVLLIAWTITGGLGHLLSWDARLRFPWPLASTALLLAYWFTAAALLFGLSRAIGPRGGLRFHAVVLSWHWSLISLLLALLVPGASYLFLVPGVFLVASLALADCRPLNLSSGLALAAVAVGAIWIPNERLFYDALGFAFPLAVAFRPLIACSILVPWFCQIKSTWAWRIGIALVIAAVCFAASAIAQNRWAA